MVNQFFSCVFAALGEVFLMGSLDVCFVIFMRALPDWVVCKATTSRVPSVWASHSACLSFGTIVPRERERTSGDRIPDDAIVNQVRPLVNEFRDTVLILLRMVQVVLSSSWFVCSLTLMVLKMLRPYTHHAREENNTNTERRER